MQNIGIVITCYNRPALLKTTLEELNKTILPKVEHGCVVIIDDASQNNETVQLISDFKLLFPDNWELIKIFHNKNQQMYNSLREGFDLLIEKGFTILCNIDSDVLVKPYWLSAELRLHEMFPDNIISGFNFKPELIEDKFKFIADGYLLRPFMGGINFLFSKDIYYRYVRPAFESKLQWDWKACDNQFKDGKHLVTTCPSVVQHNIDLNDKSKDTSIVVMDFDLVNSIFEK